MNKIVDSIDFRWGKYENVRNAQFRYICSLLTTEVVLLKYSKLHTFEVLLTNKTNIKESKFFWPLFGHIILFALVARCNGFFLFKFIEFDQNMSQNVCYPWQLHLIFTSEIHWTREKIWYQILQNSKGRMRFHNLNETIVFATNRPNSVNYKLIERNRIETKI